MVPALSCCQLKGWPDKEWCGVLALKVCVQTELKLPKVGECLMPSVKVRDNEPFDVALRRFKRSCEKAGVLSEVRRREHYEKPTAERKRKAAAAVKRHAKKLQRERKRFERLY